MLSFKSEIRYLVIYERYAAWQQLQNFSTVSPELCLPSQKNTGTWGVNATIAKSLVYKHWETCWFYDHIVNECPVIFEGQILD